MPRVRGTLVPIQEFGARAMDCASDEPAMNDRNSRAQRKCNGGIRFRNKLLHDGRTTDIPTAIRAHDGQGATARNAFNALSAANQHNVVRFI